MREKSRLCQKGRKVKDTIRQSVVPVPSFKGSPFMGLLVYKSEHGNNSRRSLKLMELPDKELPL